jgi:deazaflavin-dependent oxidoreductase (nitroreductase family)
MGAAQEELARQLAERARTEGLSLTGPGGLLGRLTKVVLESALDGEMDAHLGYAKHDPAGNGAPSHPDWYYNLTAACDGSVERGTETYKVTVRELTGAERDHSYAEQARRYPGLAEYARQYAGIRTIPVLELSRAEPTHRITGIR